MDGSFGFPGNLLLPWKLLLPWGTLVLFRVNGAGRFGNGFFLYTYP